MDACVALAGGYLREAGARVDVIDTGGFPLLLGRFIQDPSFPTVTIYNHLDVQPAEAADGWRTPPFAHDHAPRSRRAAPLVRAAAPPTTRVPRWRRTTARGWRSRPARA